MSLINDVFYHRREYGLDVFTGNLGGRRVSCFGPLCTGSWAYRVFKRTSSDVDHDGTKQTLEEAVIAALGFALDQPFQTLEEALREAEASRTLRSLADL